MDDFSDYNFIDTNKILSNTLIIHSEFKGRGELLPYYYYLNNKLFDRAVILQDSVFINQYIDFGQENQFLWSFDQHFWEEYYNIPCYQMYDTFGSNKEIMVDMFIDPNLWKGCFGVMSVLSHEYLCNINRICDLSKLLEVITTREHRMTFERVFGIMFCLCNRTYYNKGTGSVFGDLHKYINSRYGEETFTSYIQKSEWNYKSAYNKSLVWKIIQNQINYG